MRVVVDTGRVGEEHLHAVAGEFVENDHLIGVDAGEAVGRQAPCRVDQPGLGGVAQRVEPGPVQSGSGQPVVDELGDEVVVLGADPLTQRF